MRGWVDGEMDEDTQVSFMSFQLQGCTVFSSPVPVTFIKLFMTLTQVVSLSGSWKVTWLVKHSLVINLCEPQNLRPKG